jgi:hypothetical protein
LRTDPGLFDCSSRILDPTLPQQCGDARVVRVRRIGIALLRLLEDRERRIEAAEFELRAGAQHQRCEVLIGVDVNALEYGKHADWIAHDQRGAREQNSKLVAFRETQDSGFEHPQRVRGFTGAHHQRR